MNSRLRLYSIFKLRCPRCYKGNLFINPGLFVIRGILKMPANCKECNQDFKIEPGFYSAALWISYPIVLLIFIPLIFLIILLNERYGFSFEVLIPIFTIICLVLQIPIMRLSRAILIHMTINYFRADKKE